MPVPTTLADLDTVASNNFPTGSEPIGTNLDDYLRSHAALIKQVSNTANAAVPTNGALGTPTSGTLTNCVGLPIAGGGTGAATAADARTNLGLGSAATLTAGTSANNSVQLTASAKYPAVDGSLITNINLSNHITGTPYAGYTISYSGSSWVASPFGYESGLSNGSSVTQSTNKSNGVTINALSGRIIMSNSALAANTTAFFTMTNSKVTSTSIVFIQCAGGVSSMQSYNVWAQNDTAGYLKICVKNISTGSLSEAVELRFIVINCPEN